MPRAKHEIQKLEVKEQRTKQLMMIEDNFTPDRYD